MEASLDTNVIIHLYKAGFQSVLFRRFHKLKVYEFIRTKEMVNHALPEIINYFDHDVEIGKIELITDSYLIDIGMYNVFRQYVKDLKLLFEYGDLGEVYAISLAKTLGCISLVTDDIKERGPHYTLMRIPESDVMPFAFYELLILDYLEGIMHAKDLLNSFNIICDQSGLNMSFTSKLKGFIRRFWKSPYSESEKNWMRAFCYNNNINAEIKFGGLIKYLSEIGQA